MAAGLISQTRVSFSYNIYHTPCFIKSRLSYSAIHKDEMKKQNSIYIALVIILTASLACSVGGTAPSTESGQEPTVAGGQTNPVATTAPSQEAVGIDGPPGPETIDLTNPALYIVPSAPAFTFEMTSKYVGVDTTGVAKEVSQITWSAEVQTQPQITQRFFFGGGDEYSDTVIIGDQMTIAQMFSVSGGTPELFCNTSLASSMQGPSMLESMFKLQDMITGQAPRVESGIEVNGYVTDKYELSSENFVEVPGELVSAFVYVARDGGFITLFELQGRSKTDYQGLDPNQFTDVTSAYNFIPVEDGSLDIAIPAECNNPAGLAGEFPVMDGATELSTSLGQVSYKIEKPRSEVADFYRAEMPKRGWALTTEGTLIGISLVFTKDGKNVEVTVASNSATSAFVAITEK